MLGIPVLSEAQWRSMVAGAGSDTNKPDDATTVDEDDDEDDDNDSDDEEKEYVREYYIGYSDSYDFKKSGIVPDPSTRVLIMHNECRYDSPDLDDDRFVKLLNCRKWPVDFRDKEEFAYDICSVCCEARDIVSELVCSYDHCV